MLSHRAAISASFNKGVPSSAGFGPLPFLQPLSCLTRCQSVRGTGSRLRPDPGRPSLEPLSLILPDRATRRSRKWLQQSGQPPILALQSHSCQRPHPRHVLKHPARRRKTALLTASFCILTLPQYTGRAMECTRISAHEHTVIHGCFGAVIPSGQTA